MNPSHASDEVTDLIASIEMHRQEIERESGLDASRNYALPRLQELLKSEQDASQQPADGVPHAANIEAVNNAIRKLQSLGRGGQRGPGGKPQGQFRGPRREGGGAPGQPGRPGHGQQRHRGRRQQARRGGGGGGGGGGR
ncbi:MAG TPA: hypothetical protein VHL85_08825 [Burkholderiales bacterium]|jgi:hypothetical protein|nr:hypothetical protein [Burkholderiales bacterium]